MLPFVPAASMLSSRQPAALPATSSIELTTPGSGPLPRSGDLRSAYSSGLSPSWKVVVLENDPRMARYLRAHLEEQRYQVQVVSHGLQFLRQLDLKEPDLILLASNT